jgi:hypothetical protein
VVAGVGATPELAIPASEPVRGLDARGRFIAEGAMKPTLLLEA